jgi:putative DNA-invertase from lambdoid prophage Rac
MIEPGKRINKIYGYCRVSTVEQARHGVSIELQKRHIEEFVREKYNREVDGFFIDEGVSGKVGISERPGSHALTMALEEWDIVISTRLDRLSRSTHDLLQIIPQLQESNVTLFFCEQFGDVPIVYPRASGAKGLRAKFDMNQMTNQIMLMVLSAVAELEHGLIKDRFADGKVDWATRGYSIGGSVPYGYRKVRERHGNNGRVRLEPVPDEQRVIRTIQRLSDRGLGHQKIATQVRSLHANARDMNRHKVRRILERKEQGLHYEHV